MNTAPSEKSLSRSIQADWYTVHGVEKMDTFLTTIVSDEDHWMYIASNGGLTAGRMSPEFSLFPYHTQDKLIDLAHTTGPVTLIRPADASGDWTFWEPLNPWNRQHPRKMGKKLDGTQVSFTEQNPDAGLEFAYAWGFSRSRGFIRKATLRNTGEAAVNLEIADGLQNPAACDVDPNIYNRFSILLDAYKRCEKLPDINLRLIYLNSIPTDRADPLESLRCTVVWSCGLPDPVSSLSFRQLEHFRAGREILPETEIRGQRAAVMDVARISLDPGQEITWYTVADVGLGMAAVSRLRSLLQSTPESGLAELLETDLRETSTRLVEKVASADGLQMTADPLRNGRHYSNVLFNIMRGGIFPYAYDIPREHFFSYVRKANRRIADRLAGLLRNREEWIRLEDLRELVKSADNADLERLASEYLPLAFSRRHGDPSRPWNAFSIRVRDEQGKPVLAYQGNWRDIFQNWEALAYSFPEFVDGMVSRFLNASTADGYNPYRLTSEGFEWEVIEPDEPWSNIGYWGDHQLIYLLRLLEASMKVNPSRLKNLLRREQFSYARVPYRIKSYRKILDNPRNSILFDHAAEKEILERVESIGSDGKLLADSSGGILRVNMMEKVLVPLLAKLSNFVPNGGIWMNTQRPEWNDANNALAGYGLSVVTLAYAHRYILFLEELLESESSQDPFKVSSEVAVLMHQQKQVFSQEEPSKKPTPAGVRAFMDKLGDTASEYRSRLYDNGLSGTFVQVKPTEILDYLKIARKWVAASLRECRRPDGLYHSYNLIEIHPGGDIGIKHLYEMLEGQVAILSSGLLSPKEAVTLLDALRGSAMYREDQNRYMLYPERELPRFLEKNLVSGKLVRKSRLLKALADDPDQRILEEDASGNYRFGGRIHNRDDLEQLISALPDSYRKLLAEEPRTLFEVFEETFKHHAFTGRSGSFFAYEGLGSIYWHMVSKLVLGIQEMTTSAAASRSTRKTLEALKRHYHDAMDGLGLKKEAAHYGAFPTDAYSHTPKHAGAQQPGMTGQVKEDILSRFGELGVNFHEGCLEFNPLLLDPEEFLKDDVEFAYTSVTGEPCSISLPTGSLAFTLCQVPIIYCRGDVPRIEVQFADGKSKDFKGRSLPAGLCSELFRRTGSIRQVTVTIAQQ